MKRRRGSRQGKSPMQCRALDAAETAWEASGVRYQYGQIDGLAHLFVVFAENEIRRKESQVSRVLSPGEEEKQEQKKERYARVDGQS